MSDSSVESQLCCFCFSWKRPTRSTAWRRAARSRSSTTAKARSNSAWVTSSPAASHSTRSNFLVYSTSASSPRLRTWPMIPWTTSSTSRPDSSLRCTSAANFASNPGSLISRNCMVRPHHLSY